MRHRSYSCGDDATAGCKVYGVACIHCASQRLTSADLKKGGGGGSSRDGGDCPYGFWLGVEQYASHG